MSVTYKGSTVNRIVHNGTALSEWSHKNTVVFRAEKSFSNQTLSVWNVPALGAAKTAEVALGDMRGFANFGCSYTFSVGLNLPNENGVLSAAELYLKFSDGSRYRFANDWKTLFLQGETYGKSGTAVVPLSGKSDTQLANVSFLISLGEMSAQTPSTAPDGDKHTLTATISNVRCY